jgi:thymidylate synthase
MWEDYNEDGMSDFMCTNAVQYMIRDEQLIAVVQMRSNDVVFGYRNDYAWQWHVANQLSEDLGLKTWPKIIWHVGNLHVYERHFDKVK